MTPSRIERASRCVNYFQVADGARINTRGLAAVSRSKTGRGQVTAPIFLLVPQVKLPKRLDLDRMVLSTEANVLRGFVR